ncbi:MAG: hypothetical protein KDE09_18005 [Anaerolineales bacterium]|nr:hypothetical protein [Anaerolineales bacterium]MCB0004940.1 hypothetical protein [Anaerolineales bacterium]MCB0019693.1 hypothetical protein [Anaerolineales bacterium]
MTGLIPFTLYPGRPQEVTTYYLPYGTRTLRIMVTNGYDRPYKIWLRPRLLPESYPASNIFGYADNDLRLWVHWAGGMEPGACVKTDEKEIVRDKSLRFWEVVPVELEVGESKPVFLNLSHLGRRLGRKVLTLQVVTATAAGEQVLDTTLKIVLEPPAGQGFVQPIWKKDQRFFRFSGSLLPAYQPRWWPREQLQYEPAGQLPSRLILRYDKAHTQLLYRPENGEWRSLLRLRDYDWQDNMTAFYSRPVIPEIFHFCGPYYAVRLWFLWLNKRLGGSHEVPDAERFDLIFHRDTGEVAYVGTDFHYKELWGPLRGNETEARVALGISAATLDTMAAQSLLTFIRRGSSGAPTRQIEAELCGMPSFQTGAKAHVPLLENVDVFAAFTSIDVRKL